jgi:hypothetical protein
LFLINIAFDWPAIIIGSLFFGQRIDWKLADFKEFYFSEIAISQQ